MDENMNQMNTNGAFDPTMQVPNPDMSQQGGMMNQMGQQGMMNQMGQRGMMPQQPTKFCQSCGAVIPAAAVICTNCGCQTGQMQTAAPNIVIQNTNTNVNTNTNMNGMAGGRPKNKWVSFLLCLFLGWIGAHKFYEGKALLGIVYLLTLGLFGLGWFIDCLILLFKPNPYYV